METAVKERLVGAVVLVGLIVALVPELLSGPRREGANAAASADGAVRTFTIDLAPLATSPEAEAAESGEETTESQSPAIAAVRPQASAAAPATTETQSAPTVVTARAEAPPAITANTDTGWAVQLGSFANRENAEKLAAEIKASGYRAFVSKFEAGSRVRYRVRVGPEQDRAQAEALARRLQRDGRQVSIVSHP